MGIYVCGFVLNGKENLKKEDEKIRWSYTFLSLKKEWHDKKFKDSKRPLSPFCLWYTKWNNPRIITLPFKIINLQPERLN